MSTASHTGKSETSCGPCFLSLFGPEAGPTRAWRSREETLDYSCMVLTTTATCAIGTRCHASEHPRTPTCTPTFCTFPVGVHCRAQLCLTSPAAPTARTEPGRFWEPLLAQPERSDRVKWLRFFSRRREQHLPRRLPAGEGVNSLDRMALAFRTTALLRSSDPVPPCSCSTCRIIRSAGCASTRLTARGRT